MGSRGGTGRPEKVMRAALAAIAIVLLAPDAGAAGGAYKETAHGDKEQGVRRQRGVTPGACSHCHSRPIGAVRGSGEMTLFAPNDNTLCFTCHAETRGSFTGRARFSRSAHGLETGLAWPGPEPRARPTTDGGKCLNCHDPHGVRDGAGVIPDMLRLRGEALCLGCHGGGRGSKDVGAAFRQPYHHPLTGGQGPATSTLRSTGLATAGAPAAAGCSACHNPHVEAVAATQRRAPAPPPSLQGVAHVRVTSGAPGSEPSTVPVPADDATPAAEHEVCFGCHAKVTARGGGSGARLSVAAQFNPANASFHPVLAQARSTDLDRAAFANGWTADRQVYCSDCHSGDDGRVRGPHGSSYEHILKKRYPTVRGEKMVANDLCFDCHAFKTYGDPAGGAAVDRSRFPGHASHVARGDGCFVCHESHGAATQPTLIALRTPGITSFKPDMQGGSCTVSCHRTAPPSAKYRTSLRR